MSDEKAVTPQQRLEALVVEAMELRYRDGGDPDGALGTPNFEFADAMLKDYVRVRRRADRVDAIRTAVTRIRWQAKRAKDDKAFSAELAFDEAAIKAQGERDPNSFSSRDERKAEAMLGSLTQKRELRAAERWVDTTQEAYEIVDQIHWQLGAMRRETMQALRAIQVDQNLDH